MKRLVFTLLLTLAAATPALAQIYVNKDDVYAASKSYAKEVSSHYFALQDSGNLPLAFEDLQIRLYRLGYQTDGSVYAARLFDEIAYNQTGLAAQNTILARQTVFRASISPKPFALVAPGSVESVRNIELQPVFTPRISFNSGSKSASMADRDLTLQHSPYIKEGSGMMISLQDLATLLSTMAGQSIALSIDPLNDTASFVYQGKQVVINYKNKTASVDGGAPVSFDMDRTGSGIFAQIFIPLDLLASLGLFGVEAGPDGTVSVGTYTTPQIVPGEAPGGGYLGNDNTWKLGFQPMGSYGKTEKIGDQPGSKRDSFAGIVYLERMFGDNFTLGLSGDIGRSHIEYDGSGNRSNSDDVGVSLYARYHIYDWFIGANAGYAHSKVESTRQLPAFNLTGETDMSMNFWSAGLQTGYSFYPQENIQITPLVGVSYLYTRVDKSNEKGAGVYSLHTDAYSMDSVIAHFDILGKAEFEVSENLIITPHVNIGVAQELADTQVNMTASFYLIPDFPSFSGESGKIDRTTFNFGTGVDFQINEGIFLSLDYQASVQEDYQGHTGFLSVGLEF